MGISHVSTYIFGIQLGFIWKINSVGENKSDENKLINIFWIDGGTTLLRRWYRGEKMVPDIDIDIELLPTWTMVPDVVDSSEI